MQLAYKKEAMTLYQTIKSSNIYTYLKSLYNKITNDNTVQLLKRGISDNLLKIINNSSKILKCILGLLLFNNIYKYGIYNTIKSIKCTFIEILFISAPYFFMYVIYKILNTTIFPINIILIAVIYYVSTKFYLRNDIFQRIGNKFHDYATVGFNSFQIDNINEHVEPNSSAISKVRSRRSSAFC